MNGLPETRSDTTEDEWAGRIQQTARKFVYPLTPDIVPTLRKNQRGLSAGRRIWRYALLTLLIFSALMTVPEIRAGVLSLLQIGAVRINPVEPTLSPSVGGTATVSPTPLQSALDLPGETTLEAAREAINFAIRLPTYPVDLGEPDRVFLQTTPFSMLTLVWLDQANTFEAELVLTVIHAPGFAEKYYPWEEQRVLVNGSAAIWLNEPHMIYVESGDPDQNPIPLRRLIHSGVLIWTQGSLTYRLETDLPRAEAIRLAESLE